jgi:hypothetical protein
MRLSIAESHAIGPYVFRKSTSQQLRRIFGPENGLKLDRRYDVSVVVFWTIYTGTDRPCLHSVRRVRDQNLFSVFLDDTMERNQPPQARALIVLYATFDLWPSSESIPPQSVQGVLLGRRIEPDRKHVLIWSNIPTHRLIPLR